MKIAIIGAGYVGLTSAAVFAKLGHTVWAVDNNEDKIRLLQKGNVPFFEPKLPELVKKNVKTGRLIPTSDYSAAVKESDVVFICVGTPMLAGGEADLSQVFAAAKQMAKYLNNGVVVVNKSTVPVGTTEKVREIIRKNSKINFDVASCPEFLREGHAVENTLNPERIVVGVDSKRAKKILAKLHEKLPGERVITDIRTAEMVKYASNAFLATKISFINEIANLCEELGANVSDVALGMGLDSRIGKAFLHAGIGYGGSCFPKDTRALHSIAFSHNYDFKLLKAVIEINQLQRKKFLEKVKKSLGNLKGKKIGVLGLAFKNNTDDIRESAAIEIIELLMKEGASVTAYDPKAIANAKRAVSGLRTGAKPEDVAKDASAILILTEWTEFAKLNWKSVKTAMKRPLILDGRNLLNPEKMRKMGFEYVGIGTK